MHRAGNRTRRRAGLSAARALVVAAGGAVVATAGGLAVAADGAALLRPGAWHTGGAGALQAVVGQLAALAAGAVLVWLGVGAVVVAADAAVRARGLRRPALQRTAAVVLPAAGRRLVAAALGLHVVGAGVLGTALSAGAAAPPRPAAVHAGNLGAVDPAWAPVAPVETTPPVTTGGVDLEPGWSPARPQEPVRVADAGLGPLATGQRASAAVEDAVVVRRGDTLWDVAARRLPAGATDAEIAAEWPRWYAANRAVVGPDPDHVEPGMRLVPPAAGARS